MADGRFHEVVIKRDSSDVPWGFRLTENSRYPTVVRLNPRSVAARVLQTGDLILKIGNQFTEAKPYSVILQLIKDSGNELELVVDRGNAAKAMWATEANEVDKVPPQPQPMFHSVHRMEPQNKKPFTYTPNPTNLERELQERHDAMRRDRQQNLARTAATFNSRANLTPTAALEAAMPRFSLSDEKDYTQSEVFRLLDEEESPRMPVYKQPIRSAMSRSNANDQGAKSQNKKTVKVLRFLSDEETIGSPVREERSVKITEETTAFPYTQDDTDGQCKVGEYQQKSIRYLGRNIPSKSFRMLQSLMGPDEEYEFFEQPRRQFSFEPQTNDDPSCTDF